MLNHNTNRNTMTNENIIVVCSECAAGIANDDWTHLDFYQDEDVNSSIAAFLEIGWLSSVSGTREGDAAEAASSQGYYTCPCCGCDALGGSAFMRDSA